MLRQSEKTVLFIPALGKGRKMAKVLVIGGAGYIGSNVVKALLEKGHQVAVYDNLSTGQKVNLFEQAEFIEGDILDSGLLFDTLRNGFDAVVHLAAKKAVGESMEKPNKYSINNIQGSLNILMAMAECGVRHIVFSSSAAVYGMPEYLPVDEAHPLNPINYYGFTKLEIEKFMDWYDRLKDMRYVALRYFNAVGYDSEGKIRGKEKNPQNLLPIIMETAAGVRDGMSVFGSDYDTRDGTCIRDYIHVSDLASAHVLAIEKLIEGMPSAVLNLGTGEGTSVKEMIDAAEKVTGKKLNVTYAGRRAGDPATLIASSEKARNLLGWKPQITDIEEIIRTTWNLEH